MNHTCQACSKSFQITNWDVEFYKKMEVPVATLCPDCRQQRRAASVNQLFLFKNVCAATQKPLISNYHPDDGYVVYDQAYWYSDKWDSADYGVDFDFSRPFFEQYAEMAKRVPRPALVNGYEYDVNSPYTNYSASNKNCHMIFDSDSSEDSYYSYSINNCKNCMDCYRVRDSELCYECVDCINCYGSWYLQDCANVQGGVFLKDCVNVKNSFMCVGLRHKEFHIFNKPVKPEEFKEKVKELMSRKNIEQLKKEFADFCLKIPNRFMHGLRNEDVMGDYLNNCKSAIDCFDCIKVENSKYYYQAFDDGKDCMDVEQVGVKAELCYECSNVGYTAYNVRFTKSALSNLSNLTYCDMVFHCRNLFGCVGMNKKQFCILNKQYTEDEYKALVPKIIEHMKQTGEWGEFFPIQYSSFAYNESHAYNFYPLSKADVISRGWKWRDQVTTSQVATLKELPDLASEVTDALSKELLQCPRCFRNYKLTAQEILVYQKASIPVPSICFYCRHQDRIAKRNPRNLWHRQCMCTQPTHGHTGLCTTEFETSYSPDRKELVYCESCYQKEVI